VDIATAEHSVRWAVAPPSLGTASTIFVTTSLRVVSAHRPPEVVAADGKPAGISPGPDRSGHRLLTRRSLAEGTKLADNRDERRYTARRFVGVMNAALPPGPRQPGWAQAFEYTMRFPAYTTRLHARYGSSYTLRIPGLPPTVVTSDRALVRHMLTGDPHTRRHANDILGALLGDGSVMMLEPASHIARRRLLLPAFHGEQVKGYRQLVRQLVDADLDTWPTDQPLRVHDHSRQLTLAVIQFAVLGSRDDDLARRLGGILDDVASPAVNFALFAPALQRPARWNIIGERFRRVRRCLDELMAERVRATRADSSLGERTDLLALLMRATDENGRGLSDQELIDELKTLLIAGHESTATAIAWAADILAHDDEAAERLSRAAGEGDAEHISRSAKEVLRLRTVAPVSVARTLLEAAETEGHVLPSETVVVVDAFSLHRTPELHPNPEAFRPDRFAEGGPPPYSYLPFGGGAHRCLGAPLASLELEIFLAAVSERFKLSPLGPPEKAVRRGPTLVPAKGATVRARPRL
jgi:cytochrome P450